MMYAGFLSGNASRAPQSCWRWWKWQTVCTISKTSFSGGQKQPLHARAMQKTPPSYWRRTTGALDSKTGRLVMDLFHRLNEEQGKTIVLITHNRELARRPAHLTMHDGNFGFRGVRQ